MRVRTVKQVRFIEVPTIPCIHERKLIEQVIIGNDPDPFDVLALSPRLQIWAAERTSGLSRSDFVFMTESDELFIVYVRDAKKGIGHPLGVLELLGPTLTREWDLTSSWKQKELLPTSESEG